MCVVYSAFCVVLAARWGGTIWMIGQPSIVYCTISFNSAPSVTRYQLAEILILAGPDLNVTSKYFQQVGCNFCVRSLKIVHCQLIYIYYLHNVVNAIGEPLEFFCIFNLLHRIFRWFRHLTKICVTTGRMTR